jgi:hypothetical protein
LLLFVLEIDARPIDIVRDCECAIEPENARDFRGQQRRPSQKSFRRPPQLEQPPEKAFQRLQRTPEVFLEVERLREARRAVDRR